MYFLTMNIGKAAVNLIIQLRHKNRVVTTNLEIKQGERVMKILGMLIIIFSVMNAMAQVTFEKTYGTAETEEANAVIQTQDQGYLVAGYSRIGDGGAMHIYLVKTDEQGDTAWTKTYNSTWSQWANDILETGDGYLLAGGAVISTGPAESAIYLVKIDNQGDTLWTEKIGGTQDEYVEDIQPTFDGGYILCGYADEDYYACYNLVKTTVDGELSWSKKYGCTSRVELRAQSVQQTADSGYIMAGYADDYTYGDGTGYMYLVKTDSIGDTLWTKKYDWSSYEIAYSVHELPEGGYIIGGYTSSFGAGASDFLLMKTDELGDSLWMRTYGGTADERAFSAQITADGGYALSGYTHTYGAGFFDFYLLKTDSKGDTMWTRTYGGTNQEMANDMEQTTDGGYVLTGYTYSFGAGSRPNFYLVKTDASGLITSLSDPIDQPVADFHLYQNYPNPFNPVTTIAYVLNKTTDINLSIYDTEGRLVNTLISSKQSPGYKTISWSGIDNKGNKVSSGIYFCVLKGNGFHESLKMILLK